MPGLMQMAGAQPSGTEYKPYVPVAPVTIDARDAMRDVTLTVHVRIKNLWRVALGVRIICFGAWVAGIGDVKIEEQ
jgi:hypothetical protein